MPRPKFDPRKATPIEALKNPQRLRAWVIHRLDTCISLQRAKDFLREEKIVSVLRASADDRRNCWGNSSSQTYLLFKALRPYLKPTAVPPTPRPPINPHRVHYALDDYDRVVMHVHGGWAPSDFLSPIGEYAYRVREERIGELDVNEILF